MDIKAKFSSMVCTGPSLVFHNISFSIRPTLLWLKHNLYETTPSVSSVCNNVPIHPVIYIGEYVCINTEHKYNKYLNNVPAEELWENYIWEDFHSSQMAI